MPISFEDISQAAARIEDHVSLTPCLHSPALSEITGMRIFCKHEERQRTGSFKERGARNALELLSAEQKRLGVIAASAGNHALGLSYHAQRLHIPATVVMPRFAPLTKVVNCRKLGAEVMLHGDNIGEARARADEIAVERRLAYINGFDDPAIIAGQGTLGIEVLSQVPDADAIIVPIGGGGLIAGVSLAVKHIQPRVLVIGVEPERAASFHAARHEGRPVLFPLQPTLADGLSVPMVGPNSFHLLSNRLDDLLQVREQDIARAILRLMELEKVVVEGAGATPLAACLAGLRPDLKGKTVVLPLCGGNIDLTTLDRVIERGLATEGRLSRFSATISDRPGGLARFANVIADEGGSIVDITHDRIFADEDITRVSVHCVVETTDRNHITRLRKRLSDEGFLIR